MSQFKWGNTVKIKALSLENIRSINQLKSTCEVEMVKVMMDGIRLIRDQKFNLQYQELEDGKQYFVMHPLLRQIVDQKLRQL